MVAKRAGPLEVVVPAVPRLAAAVRQRGRRLAGAGPRGHRPGREAGAPSGSARAALTKSGTSTLELALAGIPMVAAYKVSLLEEIVGARSDQGLHA